MEAFILQPKQKNFQTFLRPFLNFAVLGLTFSQVFSQRLRTLCLSSFVVHSRSNLELTLLTIFLDALSPMYESLSHSISPSVDPSVHATVRPSLMFRISEKQYFWTESEQNSIRNVIKRQVREHIVRTHLLSEPCPICYYDFLCKPSHVKCRQVSPSQ